MLNMKLQYFGRFMRRTDSLEKTVMPEKTGKEEKGAAEDGMVGWHHRLKGHESEQTLGVCWRDREASRVQSMGSQSQT